MLRNSPAKNSSLVNATLQATQRKANGITVRATAREKLLALHAWAYPATGAPAHYHCSPPRLVDTTPMPPTAADMLCHFRPPSYLGLPLLAPPTHPAAAAAAAGCAHAHAAISATGSQLLLLVDLSWWW